LTKLTVRHGFEEGGRGLLLALADEGQPFVPAAHQREVLRAKLRRAVAALVETVQHRDRQAGVEAVACRYHLAVPGDGVGHAADRLFVERVRERRTGDLARGVPARREDRIAGAQRVGGLLAQPAIFAGEADAASLGENFEKEAAGEGRPAVAAECRREPFVLAQGGGYFW
jgi:hypothetical protein